MGFSLFDVELEFIFDPCVAGKMLIINPQGSPGCIVPGGTYSPEDVEDREDSVLWVDNAEELSEVLASSSSRFREFRNLVLGRSQGEQE
jgi:hypothetical protein